MVRNLTEELSVIGQRVPKVNGFEKATGAAKFCTDLKLPGMLYGKVKRSSHPFKWGHTSMYDEKTEADGKSCFLI